MQVGNPAAVLVIAAHVTDQVAGFELVTGLQTAERLVGHVPPQRQKWRATGRGVLEHHQAAITQRVWLDLDASDGAGNRCVQRRTRWHQQIYPHMQGPVLPLDEARLEGAVGIDGTYLAPWPDAQRGLVRGRAFIPPPRRICRALLGRGNGHLVAGIAKRRDDLVQNGG
ncbi:hypothetical protein D3C80_494900 [compost metagenome]